MRLDIDGSDMLDGCADGALGLNRWIVDQDTVDTRAEVNGRPNAVGLDLKGGVKRLSGKVAKARSWSVGGGATATGGD